MPNKEVSLQEVLQRLEKIADELNQKDLDVEQSLKKFKEGKEFLKAARVQLKKAENEFEVIRKELEQDS